MSNARNIADAGHQLVAWVNFDGAFADSGQTNTLGTGEDAYIRKSFNVSSVNWLAAGSYRLNFDSGVDISDTNYGFFATVASQENTNSTQRFRGTGDILKQTTYVDFKTVYVNATNGNAAAANQESVNVLITY